MKKLLVFLFTFTFSNLCFSQITIEFQNLRIKKLNDWENKTYYIIGDSTWFFDRTIVKENGKEVECFLEPQIIYRQPRGNSWFDLRFIIYISSRNTIIPEDPKVYFKMEDDEIIKTTAGGGGLLGSFWNNGDIEGQEIVLDLGSDLLKRLEEKFIRKIRIEAEPNIIEWYFDNETAADFFNTIGEYKKIFFEYRNTPEKDKMMEGF